MKKFIVVLTGMAFILGMTLSTGLAQYGPGKQEKTRGDHPIPSQDTIHLEKTSDKSTKQMQKDIDAVKADQKAQAAPPAPESKAAVAAAPPASAADTQAAPKDKKKSKKSKKDKKSKKN